jgi:hypothetical protein
LILITIIQNKGEEGNWWWNGSQRNASYLNFGEIDIQSNRKYGTILYPIPKKQETKWRNIRIGLERHCSICQMGKQFIMQFNLI